MENKKFNFENYSRDLYEIEKDSQKKIVDTNGVKVCWRSWGKGTPLVLLHGGMCEGSASEQSRLDDGSTTRRLGETPRRTCMCHSYMH